MPDYGLVNKILNDLHQLQKLFGIESEGRMITGSERNRTGCEIILTFFKALHRNSHEDRKTAKTFVRIKNTPSDA
jgi:hypothetical protein